jgi:hypothetical protein
VSFEKLDDYLVDGWRRAYRMYSAWFFVVLMALPDLYNAAIASNVITADQVPQFFARIVNGIAFMGLASRVVRQKKLEKDAEDKAQTAEEPAKSDEPVAQKES